MLAPPDSAPSWDHLFEFAVGQDGHFTTRQAAEAGYSPQLLVKYLRNGRVTRVRRGVYRIVHFPAAAHEDLTALWLWSEQEGVFSHDTALMLHQLSDALPRRVHMTLPASWTGRRLRVPAGVVLHHAEVRKDERVAIGPLPATNAHRTLVDCIAAHLAPDLLADALGQALARGLITKPEARALRNAGRAA